MRVSTASEYLRTLLQRGRYTFTREEVEDALGSPRASLVPVAFPDRLTGTLPTYKRGHLADGERVEPLAAISPS